MFCGDKRWSASVSEGSLISSWPKISCILPKWVSLHDLALVSFPDPPPPFRRFYLDRGADLNRNGGTAEVGLGTRLV